MSLISFIKSIFGIKSTTANAVAIEFGVVQKKSPNPRNERSCPLDIELNRMISLDKETLEMLKGVSSFLQPKIYDQKVEAIGKIDLGEGTTLYRFYLSDGITWLQIVCSNGIDESNIDQISVMSYNKIDNPTSDGELVRIAGKDSPLGLPEYTFNGHVYERMWNSEQGQTELTPYSEDVWNSDNDEYSVSHNAMLYSRELPNTERNELLLISVEESYDEKGEQSVSVTSSVGITLYSNDITVH